MQEHRNKRNSIPKDEEPKPGDTYDMPGTNGVVAEKINKSSGKKSSDGTALYHVTYIYKCPRNNDIQEVSVEAHKKEFSR